MNFIQYIKQVWKAGTSGGTPLSPDRLNHMEDGIKNNNNMISELNNNNITNNICTNLLNPTLKTSSRNGITCTNNGDGTYTLNGTASASTVFVLENTADIIKENANKTLRFVSRGDTLETYFVQIYFNNATPAKDSGSGITFKVPANVSETNVAVAITSGTVLHNIIIKPMLTTNLNATYNDFVSYTGNTGRLNADVALLSNNILKEIFREQATYYFNVINYSSYLLMLKHDGGNNVAVYLIGCCSKNDITIVSIQKNTHFNVEIDNGNVKITSTLKYWTLSSFRF